MSQAVKQFVRTDNEAAILRAAISYHRDRLTAGIAACALCSAPLLLSGCLMCERHYCAECEAITGEELCGECSEERR